jgi:hypothetical protein
MDNHIKSLIHYQKALEFAEDNRLDKALAEINIALETDIKPLYILTKSKILARQKRFQEALSTAQAISKTNNEYEEAVRLIKKIEQLKTPFAFFVYRLKKSELRNTVLFIALLSAIFVLVSGYFAAKQQERFDQRFRETDALTEKSSDKLKSLSNQFQSIDFVQQKDLTEARKLIADSLAFQVSGINIKIMDLAKKLDSESEQSDNSIDSANSKIKQLLLQTEELKQLILQLNSDKTGQGN